MKYTLVSSMAEKYLILFPFYWWKHSFALSRRWPTKTSIIKSIFFPSSEPHLCNKVRIIYNKVTVTAPGYQTPRSVFMADLTFVVKEGSPCRHSSSVSAQHSCQPSGSELQYWLFRVFPRSLAEQMDEPSKSQDYLCGYLDLVLLSE